MGVEGPEGRSVGGDEVLELVGEIGVGPRDGAEAVDAVDGQVVDGVLDGVFGDGGRVDGQIEEDGQGAARTGGGVDDFVRDGCVLAGFAFEGFDLAGPERGVAPFAAGQV
ncbi:hypothetical protein [Streptomyces canus]|uniref:hypothetical protein n=1 Tax=Streptomyces canus TaxID=58343 RepID=UPI00324B25FC